MKTRSTLHSHLRDKSPLQLCLVCGNHLGHLLITQFGADHHRLFPYDADSQEMREKLEDPWYDIWCAWSICGKARKIAEEEGTL